ncbi:MAG: hypothetical protein ACJAS3_003617 [Roseivirga sp.]|jgi:hypothetical protein
MVALFCGAMFLSPNLARAEGDELFAPTCYCDQEHSGMMVTVVQNAVQRKNVRVVNVYQKQTFFKSITTTK